MRLAKLVAIQHAHPDLYELLRLRPGYLRDLERLLSRPGRRRDDRESGAAEQAPPLPEALAAVRGARGAAAAALPAGREPTPASTA